MQENAIIAPLGRVIAALWRACPRCSRGRAARLAAGLVALISCGLVAIALASPGQPGSIDTSFANHGIATFGSGPAATIGSIAAQVVQPDGKVVLVGTSTSMGHTRMGVVRMNPDGSLDTTFGAGTGGALIDFGSGGATATGVALQSNKDIIVAGTAGNGRQIAVARLAPTGSPDMTFGAGNGQAIVDTTGTTQGTVGVAVQRADQNIAVVGRQDMGFGTAFQVSRLTTTGQMDSSFSGGTVTTKVAGGANGSSSASVVAIQADGRIVVAGAGNATGSGPTDFQVARYTGTGTLDGSFNPGGAQPGTNDIGIPAEGPSGVVTNALALQPADGKIVIAGGPPGGPQSGRMTVAAGHTALVRLKIDGTPDGSFSGGGLGGGQDAVQFPGASADTANGVAVDPATGTILLAGTAELNGVHEIVADRLNPNGSLDQSFGDPGSAKVTPGGSAAVALLMTVNQTLDALIGGVVGNSAGGVTISNAHGSQTGGAGNGGNPPSTPPPAHAPAPVLTGMTIAPASFRAASSGPTLARVKTGTTISFTRKRKTGTTISYTDSQAATTRFTVLKPQPGVRDKHRGCVKPRRGKRGKRCTRYVSIGSFTHSDEAGRDSFHSTGRFGRRKLKPGSYKLRALPRANGMTGRAATIPFRIIQ